MRGNLLTVIAVALFIAAIITLSRRGHPAAQNTSRQAGARIAAFDAMPQFGPPASSDPAIVSHGGID